MSQQQRPPETVLWYLGPPGSHSHQVAQTWATRQNNITCRLEPAASLRDLMQQVSKQEHSVSEHSASASLPALGLLPVENALEGSVIEVMEALGLQKFSLQPVIELTAPILHALIRHPDDNAPIRQVFSHPQALGQCRERLLAAFGEDLELLPTRSTSEAVQHVVHAHQPSGQAALGSHAAVSLYGGTVIETDMSDAPGNQTRFWLVTPKAGKNAWSAALKQPVLKQSDGQVKTTLCVGLVDRPGVLADFLKQLQAVGMNLTRIESRPSKKRLGEYLFYLDIDQAFDKTLLGSFQAEVTDLHCLGPYEYER